MENTNNIKIAFIQFDVGFGKKDFNFNKVQSLISKLDADIVVLPELFTSGYFFSNYDEVLNASEPRGSETAQFLLSLAKDKQCFIYGGFAEKARDRVYNSSILAGYDGTEIYYQKAHLFGEETKFFIKGDTPLKSHEIKLKTGKKIKVGLMICFDWFFPETMRTLSLDGAVLILHTANLVMPYCPDAMITRCLENQVFSITCNRIGTEECNGKTLRYIGRSRIISNKGVVLAQGSDTEEDVKCVIIENIDDANNKNINSYNDLFKDRRTDLYKL